MKGCYPKHRLLGRKRDDSQHLWGLQDFGLRDVFNGVENSGNVASVTGVN